MAIELKDHQKKALRDLKNGSILAGDVGSGKTLTSLAYWYIHICQGMPRMQGVDYQPMKTPVNLYVITTARKRDDLEWQEDAAKLGVGRKANENGVQMHVDSWNNISQYDLVTDSFFIFDEQRASGSGKWSKSFIEITKHNRWILLSATPGDVWMDFVPVFIAHGYYKNRTAFVEEHVEYDRFVKFPKVKKYHNTGKLQKIRRDIMVEMPMERHTTRHVKQVRVDYDKDLWKKITEKRWHIYEDRPIRDVAELFSLMRRVVNRDLSRYGEVLKLLEKHPRLIIFYNYNYELETLRTLKNVLPFPVAEWNGQKHEAIPDTDRWVYLVQYTAGAEGWNCTATDAMVFYSLTYSYKVFEQSQGRIDRMNTPYFDLFYYVFRSGAPIDSAIWKTLHEKKEFNRRAFANKVWQSQEGN